MTKRGQLSKVEKFYIDGNRELGSEKLAKELDRTEKQVGAYMSKHKTETKPESNPPTHMDQLMGKKRGSVVMTGEASELADATREQRSANVSRATEGAIHKPKG